MTDRRIPSGVWIAPLAGVAIVCLALALRRPAEAPAAPETVAGAAEPRRAPLRAAAPEEIEREVDPVLFATTYRNFRTAIATDNRALADTLRPTLLRRRKDALRLAEEESAAARTAADRDIVARTIDALRR
jgi:hypothetical protein